MKRKILISSIFLPIAVLLPAILPFGEATANKVKTTSLLKAKCVRSGIGSARQQKRNVSIGRAVYSSKFYLGPGYRSAALTCKISPDDRPQNAFQTLNLGFGMRDNNVNSPSVQVKLYLDGKLTETLRVAPRQVANVSVGINNISNIAIEATCSSSTQYCNRVYFYDANLQQGTAAVTNTPETPAKEEVVPTTGDNSPSTN